LKHREHRQTRSLHRYRGTLIFFSNHKKLARSRVGRLEVRRARVWVRVIRRELAETRAQLQPRPLFDRGWLAQATCIHQHEGAWNANTGNGYYGGFQFLLSTWASVGGTTRPDLAAPQEQLLRAHMVWARDGGSFREWGTAAACGLS
jgi:hypothetical protein